MHSIAIDGPTGAGKSTLAKALAKKFGYIYVDTGALYRAIGFLALEEGLDTHNEEEVVSVLKDLTITIEYVSNLQHVFVNGTDVTDKIRTEEVSMAASTVSAHASVRAFLLEMQRDFARTSNVIMDGRDIGTVVLPSADLKIFLTASGEERAGRRYKELISKGIKANYDEVLKDLTTRDFNDSNRDVAPLKAAHDAVTLDTSGKELFQVIEIVSKLIKERLMA